MEIYYWIFCVQVVLFTCPPVLWPKSEQILLTVWIGHVSSASSHWWTSRGGQYFTTISKAATNIPPSVSLCKCFSGVYTEKWNFGLWAVPIWSVDIFCQVIFNSGETDFHSQDQFMGSLLPHTLANRNYHSEICANLRRKTAFHCFNLPVPNY